MNIVLSLYPNTRGLGYACVDMPKKLLDHGVITVKPICNDKILKRVQKFVVFFRPRIIVLRDGASPSLRTKRIKQLVEGITRYAEEHNIPVYRYSRQQIRDVFEVCGATNKHEIAHKIVERFPELRFRAPKVREFYMDEDYNMGIFDALALAVAHEYLTQ